MLEIRIIAGRCVANLFVKIVNCWKSGKGEQIRGRGHDNLGWAPKGLEKRKEKKQIHGEGPLTGGGRTM